MYAPFLVVAAAMGHGPVCLLKAEAAGHGSWLERHPQDRRAALGSVDRTHNVVYVYPCSVPGVAGIGKSVWRGSSAAAAVVAGEKANRNTRKTAELL